MKQADIDRLKEIWEDVKGYEGVYQVSNIGNVRSVDRLIKHPKNGFRTLKSRSIAKIKNNKGYFRVALNFEGVQNIRSIHRIVATAFISNPENKRQVNHKNGIKTDNRVENLEWATSSENMIHADLFGLRKNQGEYNKSSKLSEEDVKKIRQLSNIQTQKTIASIFNVNQTTVGRIINYNSWNTKAKDPKQLESYLNNEAGN